MVRKVLGGVVGSRLAELVIVWAGVHIQNKIINICRHIIQIFAQYLNRPSIYSFINYL